MNLKLINNNKKFISYSVFGGMGVLTDFLIYSTLIMYGVYYQISNVTGYLSGTIVSFVLNRKFTFQIYDFVIKRFFSFISVALVGYLISSFVLYLLIGIFEINKIISKILTLFIVLIIQFTLNQKITFKE